jgi:hypothetical protein
MVVYILQAPDITISYIDDYNIFFIHVGAATTRQEQSDSYSPISDFVLPDLEYGEPNSKQRLYQYQPP